MFIKRWNSGMNKSAWMLGMGVLLCLMMVNVQSSAVSGMTITDADMSDVSGQSGSLKAIESLESTLKELIKESDANALNYEIKLATLTAWKVKYIFRTEDKDRYIAVALKSFNAVYQKIKTSDDQALLFEFFYYRGMAFIDYPRFHETSRLALADIQEAIDLAEQMDKPGNEVAQLYLALAKRYHNDKNEDKAKAMAQKVMDVTEDARMFIQAKKIINGT